MISCSLVRRFSWLTLELNPTGQSTGTINFDPLCIRFVKRAAENIVPFFRTRFYPESFFIVRIIVGNNDREVRNAGRNRTLDPTNEVIYFTRKVRRAFKSALTRTECTRRDFDIVRSKMIGSVRSGVGAKSRHRVQQSQMRAPYNQNVIGVHRLLIMLYNHPSSALHVYFYELRFLVRVYERTQVSILADVERCTSMR